MCTLIAMHRSAGTTGTLIAANRDEFYTRPSRPPEQLAPRVMAGVDVLQGGTWLGVHASGLFVGLTNQRSFGGRDASKKTRGAVVMDALAQVTLDASLQLLGSLDAREYNGFNLLLGDGDRLFVAYARPEQREVEVHALGPGVHVLGNDRLTSPDFPKAARIAACAEAHVAIHASQPLSEQVEPLRALLGSHAQPELSGVEVPAGSTFSAELLQALEATCIHTPHYGTVSATLLSVSPAGVSEYWYADGPPCRTGFQPVPLDTSSPDLRRVV
jgi:uncharacterized protein with NRDE domain